MESGKRTIGEIFSTTRVLEVPFFQRSYVWNEENWERFLDDMKNVSDQNISYFLGSIILKQKETPSDSQIGDLRGVVDGQQRLTTLCLFFRVLCDVHGEGEKFESLFKNINKEIILSHNHFDEPIFSAILNDKLGDDIREEYAQNRVLGCYNYFSDNREIFEKINFNTLLYRVYFVGIDLTKEEDEQQIFDTINSLGVSLTTAELLKNELYRKEDESLYNETWKKTFEEDDKLFWESTVTTGRHKRENIDLLMQAFLMIKSCAKEKYLGTENIFRSYRTYLRDNSIAQNGGQKNKFIKDLVKVAGVYKKYINPNFTSQAIANASAVERINLVFFGLNTTTIIPYIVYLGLRAKPEDVPEMLFLLENYLIRRMVCRETAKNYNNVFASFIRNKIKTPEQLKNKLKGKNQTDLFPSNANLKKAIFENNLTNQQAKVFLYLIEVSMRDKKDATNILGLDSYSLEHVMPKKWRNHWNSTLSDAEAIERDGLLLKLGNLTIIPTTLNSSIRDSSWIDKKKGRGDKLGLEEHSRGIKIFDRDEYLGSDKWDEEKIAHRGAFLYKQATKTWKE